MRLWVTGKNGLLGSILSEKADLSTGREVDISNLDAVRDFAQRNRGITQIVNCAAYSLVDAAETERDEATRANAIGPQNLAIVAREIGAKLVHLSTDYIFDGEIGFPLKETDPATPLNHYAWTKLEGEIRVLKELPSACIIRTSWIFGRGGKNFVAKLLKMMQTREEIRLTDDHWGRPTYVNDLADAITNMWDRSGVFHYANSGETNKYLFGCAMREEAIRFGIPIVCKQILPVPGSAFPSPCKRPDYSVFDTTKIEKFVRIRPWEIALREFLCNVS